MLSGGLSPYGTMGQGGNVEEWEEIDVDLVNRSSGTAGGKRGGYFSSNSDVLLSSFRTNDYPSSGNGTVGFRVASSIPEPSALLLLCFGSLAVLWRRRGLACAAILAAVVSVSFADRASAITIDMVPVGNPGNAPDTRYNSISIGSVANISVGSVANAYQIGTYEVTAGQYTEFLNSVADADPNGLYNTAMGDPGGSFGANIQRTINSPNFSYSVAADWANRPVNYVSFWDAIRFANWLHNGGGIGADTENGAYTLGALDAYGVPINANSVTRNAGALWFLPSENEWYKAAYHDKTAGLAASYFDFPTGMNAFPGRDVNETTNPGNNANYFVTDIGIGSPYYRTVAGEFELSASPYGTFDQGGNVFEWNETAVTSSSRGLRGGSFYDLSTNLHAAFRYEFAPELEVGPVGFRVASKAVPEPSALLLLCFGSLAVLWRRRGLACAAILAAVFGITLSNDAHAVTVRTVALSGQQAPGAPDGVNFSSFNFSFTAPVLNDAGKTAFYATLTGSGVDSTNDSGIWSEGSGSLTLVARRGSQAAGMPSGVNYGFNNPSSSLSIVLNDAGQIAFSATLIGSGVDSTNNKGIWSEESGSLALVAGPGIQAPGMPSGVNFVGINFAQPLIMNNAGQTAFFAATGSGVNSTNISGIWSEGSGSLTLVASVGSQAAGAPSGVTFSSWSGIRLNDAGQIAFRASTSGGAGIWSDRSGSLAVVARWGDQAPGTPAGVSYQLFAQPAMNNAGQTAFWATLTGGSVYDEGIWSEGSGSLKLVARDGDHAPGTPSGVIFYNFNTAGTRPVLNDRGQTAFGGYLFGSGVDSTNNEGIWSEGSGSLSLVVREGDRAPGTLSGVNFGTGTSSGDPFVPPVLNEAGQTAFSAVLTGSGVDATNNRGIWATDRLGTLQLIARTGDMLEVAPGDFRTISFLDFVVGTGNSDGRPSGFNNLGQLAFRATFTDGSAGIFVSNVVAVPEPATLVPLMFAGAGWCLRRRRGA